MPSKIKFVFHILENEQKRDGQKRGNEGLLPDLDWIKGQNIPLKSYVCLSHYLKNKRKMILYSNDPHENDNFIHTFRSIHSSQCEHVRENNRR